MCLKHFPMTVSVVAYLSATGALSQMLVYPNQLDIPLMENSGLAKPPVGMLEVTVEKAVGLKSGDMLGKGDPYVSIQVQVRMQLPQPRRRLRPLRRLLSRVVLLLVEQLPFARASEHWCYIAASKSAM